jgi:hypothetical protein
MPKKTPPLLRLHETSHPLLYEVNVRVLLNTLSRRLGKSVTLGTIPDELLDEWRDLGFDAVWLMGVWKTGGLARSIAQNHQGLREEYTRALPDWNEMDVEGSPYSVQAYAVHPTLGTGKDLAALRKRLASRGLGLILDVVCNHTARDCDWVRSHPEYYIQGRTREEVGMPDYYFKVDTVRGERVLAFGRDPTFPGWTDTAQLNIMSAPAREAIIGELQRIAGMCDGVRCDMAMLLLSDIFRRTWGERAATAGEQASLPEFWKAAVDAVKKDFPRFVFLAEAYWNREWDLQQLGIDYTYDKVLYDRLLKEGAYSSRGHLKAEMDFQRRCVRFLENHDEPRLAHLVKSEAWKFAAATVVATVPGMMLIQEGQMEGRETRVPVQLVRRPDETVSERTRSFFERLFWIITHPVFRKGEWSLSTIRPAWHDNQTWQNFIVSWWHEAGIGDRLVVVNYAPLSGQCYVDIPPERLNVPALEFRDLLGDAVFVREKAGLAVKGMYFDLPPYGIHIFEVRSARK